MISVIRYDPVKLCQGNASIAVKASLLEILLRFPSCVPYECQSEARWH